MQQQAAICEICGDTIYVEAPSGARSHASPMGGFTAALERAASAHLATHPTPVVERFLLRKHLDDLAPDARPAAVKHVYDDLRALWGDMDRAGVYTIDEVLGTLPVYQLWMSANRCTWAACRHD